MKFFKNKLAVTVIVLSVTFLGVIVYTVKNDSSNRISSSIGSAINPVQQFIYSVGDKIQNSFDFFKNFSDVKRENEELRTKNLELQQQLIDYEDYKRENEEFRKILDIQKQSEQYDYIGTNIISKSGGSVVSGYIIDKGTDNGVEKGMVVIAPEGLVGVISEANTNWAKVQPLIDENIAVSGLVQSTRESTGIVRGYRDYNNTPLAKVYYLPIDSDAKEGDIILTSGLGGIYPKGIKIGEIVSIEEDKVKVMKNAIVKPYVEFNKLEELYVVVPKDKREGIKY